MQHSQSSTAPAVLCIQDLSWGYAQALFSNLSLSLRSGGAVAVVGPNGVGKSTLLSTLAGHLPPLAGDVRVGGASLSEVDVRHASRLVARLPPLSGIDPGLRVEECVRLGRTPYLSRWGTLSEGDTDAVVKALDVCELTNLKDRLVGQLSSGEQRRVQIGLVVAQAAPLLLLDEPTTHLDLRHRDALFTLVRRLRQEGRAVVWVLHDLADAFREADSVLVLSHQSVYTATMVDHETIQRLAAAFSVPPDRVLTYLKRELP